MLASTVEYTVTFDVVQSGYRQWWFPALGLIFVAVGAVFTVFRRGRPGYGEFPSIFLGFSLLWTAGSFGVTFSDYHRLASDLRHGRCNVVEGIVTDFDTNPKGESFRVGSQPFKYSNYIVTAGFNNMQSHGGPIRAGLPIRIHHVGNDIARLETAR